MHHMRANTPTAPRRALEVARHPSAAGGGGEASSLEAGGDAEAWIGFANVRWVPALFPVVGGLEDGDGKGMLVSSMDRRFAQRVLTVGTSPVESDDA